MEELLLLLVEHIQSNPIQWCAEYVTTLQIISHIQV
jgi:hypothetical protein